MVLQMSDERVRKKIYVLHIGWANHKPISFIFEKGNGMWQIGSLHFRHSQVMTKKPSDFQSRIIEIRTTQNIELLIPCCKSS